MNVILHFGPAKTATTFLQRNVFNKLDHTVCLTPDSLVKHEKMFNALWYYSTKSFNQHKEQFRNQINSYADSYDQLIISHEHFSMGNLWNDGKDSIFKPGYLAREDIFNRLNELLIGHNIKIIFTLRRQPEAILSLYNSVRRSMRFTGTYEEFVRRAMSVDYGFLETYKYDALLEEVNCSFNSAESIVILQEQILENPEWTLSELKYFLDNSLRLELSDLTTRVGETKLEWYEALRRLKIKKYIPDLIKLPVKKMANRRPNNEILIESFYENFKAYYQESNLKLTESPILKGKNKKLMVQFDYFFDQ